MSEHSLSERSMSVECKIAQILGLDLDQVLQGSLVLDGAPPLCRVKWTSTRRMTQEEWDQVREVMFGAVLDSGDLEE